MTVFYVYPDNIPRVWGEVLPLLEKSIAMGGTHDGDDVLAALMDGRAQLWIQRSDKTDAAVVTEIATFPRVRLVRIWLAGAITRGCWDEFREAIIPWARERACKRLDINGRMGWARVVKGMNAVGMMMRMPI